jgi:hypothetical protein
LVHVSAQGGPLYTKTTTIEHSSLSQLSHTDGGKSFQLTFEPRGTCIYEAWHGFPLNHHWTFCTRLGICSLIVCSRHSAPSSLSLVSLSTVLTLRERLGYGLGISLGILIRLALAQPSLLWGGACQPHVSSTIFMIGYSLKLHPSTAHPTLCSRELRGCVKVLEWPVLGTRVRHP